MKTEAMKVIERRRIILNLIDDEVDRAQSKHAAMNSSHEAYSVILEEVDEFWEQVKLKRELRSDQKMRDELIQIAAMAVRAIEDLSLLQHAEFTP